MTTPPQDRCPERAETSDIESKMGHSMHACRLPVGHEGLHRCRSSCTETWQTTTARVTTAPLVSDECEEHIAQLPDEDIDALIEMYGLRDLVETTASEMDLDSPWNGWRTEAIRRALVAARNRGWDQAGDRS